jgi:hypothetical protein
MLVRKPPQLCQSCHDSSATVIHQLPMYNSRDSFNGDDIDSRRNRFVSRSCMNCHTNIQGSNSTGIKSFRR